jgi:hypothetical protein
LAVAFDLDRHAHDGVDAAAHRVDGEQLAERADPRSRRDGRREAHLVAAAVEREHGVRHVDQLRQQRVHERERQVAVRDRARERARSRARDVDVDPLVVVGRVGEMVDPLLVDDQPVARAEALADGRRDLLCAAEFLGHRDLRRGG